MNHLTLSVLLFLLAMVSSHSIYAQACNPNIKETAPASRFVVTNQEVKDVKTDLIWQKCALGQSGDNCSGNTQTYTWSEALQEAEIQRQNTGLLWRLPNLKELRSLIEYKCYASAINAIAFPNTIATDYWTASPYAYDGYYVWAVGFYSGLAYGRDKNLKISLRLVRFANE